MDKQSTPILIHLDYCLTPLNRVNNAAIVIENGIIRALGGYSAFVQKEKYRVFHLHGCYALPGFVDTHLSGAKSYDIMHADSSDKLELMTIALARHGVTSFVPSTQSTSNEHILNVVRTLADQVNNDDLEGAIPIGIHIEGPFISQAKRGAHMEKFIQKVDLDLTKQIIEASKGTIKIFTFAPELKKVDQLIDLLVEHKIVPCMGHTMASRLEIKDAVQHGANRCLHLYNGMEPLQQRKVGLAAISLIDDRIWVEIIPDGVHSHWGMLELACRCKRKDRLVAISNATEAAGLEDGTYHLGDREILVKNGQSTLPDGTIAGSTNFLDENYRNLLKHTQLTMEEAAACCTLNPALSIGARERGKIKPGKRADLVIMNEDHEVQMTIVNGRIAYQHESVTIAELNETADAL
ncbi:MAG: N-acetylglucosamine-6-phosphate deacetylase [Lentisphaeria bacterium]|nr:N-acetylglucosamine-6-phosphate deacetylase [Lentisphaeria bacterium]